MRPRFAFTAATLRRVRECANEAGYKRIVKNKKSVDAFLLFQVKTMFHTSNSTSLTAHEKEIHFAIRVP
jgi:hypothetical protein